METDRFINVGDCLRDGPTDFETLRRMNPTIPKRVLRKVLQKAKEDGLIVSDLYARPGIPGSHALYVLAPAGAERICRKFQCRPESIRMQLPAWQTVTHEDEVTKVFRAIRAEAAKFNLEAQLTDEYYLRIPLKGLSKNKPMPDIYLRYSTGRGASDAYDVEIDNATTPARRLYGKIEALPNRILLLSPSAARVSMLISEFAAFRSILASTEKKSSIDPTKEVYFSTIDDFCNPSAGGVYETLWQTINDGTTKITPKWTVHV